MMIYHKNSYVSSSLLLSCIRYGQHLVIIFIDDSRVQSGRNAKYNFFESEVIKFCIPNFRSENLEAKIELSIVRLEIVVRTES